MRTIEITVQEPDEEERRLSVSAGEVVLGRHPSSHVVLYAPHVSAKHGCLLVRQDRIEYRDLGSRNGSRLRGGEGRPLVEGHLSEPVEVREGDTIELGGGPTPVVVRVRFAPAGARPGHPSKGAVETTVFETLPFRSLEEMPAELEGDAAALEALYRFSVGLGQAVERETLVDGVAQATLRVFDRATSVRIYLKDPRGGGYTLALARVRGPAEPPEEGARPSQAILSRVLDEGLSVLFSDAREEFDHSESVKLSGILSGMCVPLWDRREVKGLIQVDSLLGAGLFDRRALEIATLFGNHAAIALANLELTGRLREAEARLTEENIQLKREVERTYRSKEIIGQSRAMREVFRLIEKVAPTNATALVLGDTGTGKELVASAIHYSSKRRGAVFVARNCRELPETLLESELFGHKKGSFTGATSDRKGLFELADRGTIFLDEVADTPPSVQAKLLRVLQEGEVWPIGDSRPRRVDVRVISATNRDLVGEVKAGRFREDLYFRLNVFPIVVPPLRERREDIPLLADFFLDRYRKKSRKDVRGITPEAMLLLGRYDFPGNVRQLEAAIERAVAMGEAGEPIRSEHLPDEVKEARAAAWAMGPAAGASEGQDEGEAAAPGARRRGILKSAVERFESRFLRDALEKHGGCQTATAIYLGISRMALINKINKYGLR